MIKKKAERLMINEINSSTTLNKELQLKAKSAKNTGHSVTPVQHTFILAQKHCTANVNKSRTRLFQIRLKFVQRIQMKIHRSDIIDGYDFEVLS